MNLKTEQLIKSKLGLILKVLLIALALFKLAEYIWGGQLALASDVKQQDEPMDILVSDSTDVNSKKGGVVKEAKVPMAQPTANSASIYIFDGTELDQQTSRHVGATFFDTYTLKSTPKGFIKDALLQGDLGSAANTEVVCVGTVRYTYSKDDMKNTCELILNFDTYNKVTGELVKQFSESIVQYGIGFSNGQAKQVALQKVHP